MFVNRKNYEVVLIDYLDGKLNPLQVDELMLFLSQNPDIKAEFEGLEDAVLIAGKEVFPYRSALKKHFFHSYGIDTELDYLCIANLENDITAREQERLSLLVGANNENRSILSAYKKTIVRPDANVHYTGKAWLKRALVVPIRLTTYRLAMSIAASVALFVGVYYGIRPLRHDGSITEIAVQPVALQTPTPESKSISLQQNFIPGNTKQTTGEAGGKVIKRKEPMLVANRDDRDEGNARDEAPRRIVPFEIREVSSTGQSRMESPLAIAYLARGNTKPSPRQQAYAANDPAIEPSIREIGLFDLVKMGVESFGKLIGCDVRLEAQKDRNGKIQKITYESALIAFSAPVGKNE